MTSEELKQIKEVLDVPLQPFKGGTAQLLDESDENGAVIIRDGKGHDRIIMPREVYEQLRGR